MRLRFVKHTSDTSLLSSVALDLDEGGREGGGRTLLATLAVENLIGIFIFFDVSSAAGDFTVVSLFISCESLLRLKLPFSFCLFKLKLLLL